MDPTHPELADAFKLSIDGPNVIVEFGQGAGSTDTGKPHIRVTDRIILPRAAAERLAIQLEDALRPHAAGLRLREAQALPPAQAAVRARPGPLPAPPPQDHSGERAATLIRLVGELGVPHQYERSFRISERSLQANRFLLTLNPRDLAGDARAQVLAICDRMSMPPAMRAVAEERFGMADCLHFGFEGETGSIVCKLYLERSIPPSEALEARAGGRPVLLHLAFKWDLLSGQAVTTEYHWHPALTAREIEARLVRLYGADDTASCEIARAVLDLAVQRVAPERLQYLEVEEVENDRRSFDLNLYNAKLEVRDIQPALLRMRERFGVRPGQFQALLDQIRSLPLGHIAGGTHRNGKGFFNIYYGVMALPRFNATLQQRPGKSST